LVFSPFKQENTSPFVQKKKHDHDNPKQKQTASTKFTHGVPLEVLGQSLGPHEMAFRVVLLWAFFVLSASVRCERGDNCTCRGIDGGPECPCTINRWDVDGRLRRKLDCISRGLEGSSFFMDLTQMDLTVEELFFRYNPGIISLDPEMFRDNAKWTGIFFTGSALRFLNADSFKNLPGLVKLDLVRNNISYIDAHFVTNSPVLRRVDTEDNPIWQSSNDTCNPNFFRHSIPIGELAVPLCWRQCPRGTFNSFNLSDECSVCPPGKFNDRSNELTAVQAVCSDCPCGKYGNQSGATSMSQCRDCLQGQYSDTPGDTLCDYCSPGRFSESNGTSVCSVCEAGQFAFAGDSQCDMCSAGKFSDIPGVAFCSPCDAGKYAARVGSTTCLLCAAGRYSLIASAECLACEIGKFAATGGASSCSPCNAGQKTIGEGATSQGECVASSQELLTILPFLIPGACLFAFACLSVLWLYCKDRKYVEEERAHKKYLAPISAVFGLFDFMSDVYFAYSLGQMGESKRPAWSLALAIVFLIVPCVLSLVCLGWLTCREIRRPAFYAWFKNHAAFISITLMCSATNSSTFELTYCDLGGLAFFQAPWSKRAFELLAFAGLLTNLLEDMPQLGLQLYVAQQQGWSMFVILSAAFSVLSLFSGTIKHLFLLVGWCKHHRATKHVRGARLRDNEEPFFFEAINT